MFKKSMLAAAVFAAAFSVQAATPDYSNGGSFAETPKDPIVLEKIEGGSFVREKDGAEGVEVKIQNTGDISISAGSFSTLNPANYQQGVETGRGLSIGLYNPVKVNDKYVLFTDDDIEAIFKEAETNPKILAEKFATSDGYTAEDLTINDKEKVLAALHAAKNLSAAQSKVGLEIHAGGDLNISGGTFDLHSANMTKLTADDTLTWNGATLVSQGGGGAVELSGKTAINIESGSISSLGSVNGIAQAYGFDARGDIKRNRWTLGKYLAFRSNGDITIGSEAGTGPDIYVRDGMLAFETVDVPIIDQTSKIGKVNIKGGSITLHGVTRSTLTSAWDYTIRSLSEAEMTGGELNIITEDALYADAGENVSMWTLALDMKGGVANLTNSQLNSTATYSQNAVVNLNGYSSLSGSVTINNGAQINLSENSAIGWIVGDNKGYASNATTIDINGGTLNFNVTTPTDGKTLKIGENIAGIHSNSSYTPAKNGQPEKALAATVTLSNQAQYNFNVGALSAGTYTVDGFVTAKDLNYKDSANKDQHLEGSVSLEGEITTNKLFYTATITQKPGDTHTADLTIVVNDANEAISTLTGDSYLAKNAAAFGKIAASGSGIASSALAALWMADEAALEGISQSAIRDAMRDVTNPGSAAGMFGMKNSADVIGAEVFNQASLATGVYDNTTGKRIWGTAVGDWGRVNGNSDFDIDTAGVVFGADHTFDQTVRAGFAFGALHTSSDGEGAKYTGDSYWVGMYGSWKLPMNFPLVLDADALYGWTDGDVDTTLFGRSGSADVDGDVIRVSAHASMPFELSVASVVPYIGLEWTRVSQDGYTDGSLGRSVDSLDEDALTMPIGVKFVKTIENGTTLFKGTMDIAYARDLTDFDPRLTTAYGGAGIDSESADIGEDAFRFGLGVDCHISDAWTIGAKYKLEVRDNYTDNQLKGTITFAW